MSAMEIELPFLSRETDRHGNDRVYVRRNGKRVRIREKEGTPAFAKAYAEAVETLGAPPGQRKAIAALVGHPKGSLGWLAAEYFKSKGDDGFLNLDKTSQRIRRNYLEACFRVPLSDTDPDPMGNCPLKYLSAQKIKRMMDAADGKGARSNRRRHLSKLCAWGVSEKYLPTNPVRDVKAVRRIKGSGFYTWTVEDIEQFLAYWGNGTKPRLALGLLLFAGARGQDMVSFGKQHIKGDWIQYVPKKTLYKRRETSTKPLLPILKEFIASSPCGALTFLENKHNRPYTPGSFRNWFRKRCDEAGLPMCAAHGLKKAAAMNGATTRQMMAMFDWETVEMAEVYTRAAEKRRLAGEGMALITLDRKENENCRTDEAGVVAPEKIAK